MNDIWNQTKLNGNFLCNISEQKFLANNLNNNKFIVKYKDIFVNESTKKDFLQNPYINTNLRKMALIKDFFQSKLNQEIFLKLTSTYRSPNDNKIAGGAKKSDHLLGQAFDFKIGVKNNENFEELHPKIQQELLYKLIEDKVFLTTLDISKIHLEPKNNDKYIFHISFEENQYRKQEIKNKTQVVLNSYPENTYGNEFVNKEKYPTSKIDVNYQSGIDNFVNEFKCKNFEKYLSNSQKELKKIKEDFLFKFSFNSPENNEKINISTLKNKNSFFEDIYTKCSSAEKISSLNNCLKMNNLQFKKGI